jgi:hypothetical protein
MTRPGRSLGALLLVVLACDRPTEPDATHDSDLLVQVRLTSGAMTALDSGHVLVRGPTNKTVKVTPGSTQTIGDLDPGAYTVALEGFTGGGVSHFGETTGVQVVAGQNTTATVTVAPFRPQILAIPTYTVNGTFQVKFSTVARAASYAVEVDSLPSFATLKTATSGDTTVTLTVTLTSPYYVRVRAIDPYATPGQPSDVKLVETLDTVAILPADHDTLIGAGDTVRLAARGRDAKGNLFDIPITTWQSSQAGIATINNTGLLTIGNNGTTTITATEVSGVKGTTTFKVDSLIAVPAATISFTLSNPPNHPMKLTSDGSSYFMIADGSAPSPVQQFDLTGALVGAVDVPIDARSLLFNAGNGQFYAKIFGTDWYQVDPIGGSATLLLSGIFAFNQSSPAFARDSIYEHESGTVRVLDLATGQLQRTITGLQSGGFPSSEAIATDGDHLFTWNGTTVFMYDFVGRRITSFDLSNGTWGFSLSFANGLLWTADDVGAGTSTWFGYQLTKQ